MLEEINTIKYSWHHKIYSISQDHLLSRGIKTQMLHIHPCLVIDIQGSMIARSLRMRYSSTTLCFSALMRTLPSTSLINSSSSSNNTNQLLMGPTTTNCSYSTLERQESLAFGIHLLIDKLSSNLKSRYSKTWMRTVILVLTKTKKTKLALTITKWWRRQSDFQGITMIMTTIKCWLNQWTLHCWLVLRPIR